MKPILYLAPIQGVTDRIYRNVYSKYFDGFDYAVAPFISTTRGKNSNSKLLREFDPDKNYGIKTIPQILSNDPEEFIPIANSLYEMGYGTVNWNLGCPFPMVVKKIKGAGMLCYPAKIESFLERTIPRLKSKVSIKLRLGLMYPDEIMQLIPLFNKFPIVELIIHPRTGKQMYSGGLDLDIFEQCIRLSRHPVVYNGDIKTKCDYEKLSVRFGSIDRWMIGRGALSDPFIAGEIKGRHNYSIADKIELIYKFHNELFDEYSRILSGPSHLMDKMKNVWSYLANFFPNGTRIQKIIKKINNPIQYKSKIDQIFYEASKSL
jgi:tRNA-dihydrouridine synthase B